MNEEKRAKRGAPSFTKCCVENVLPRCFLELMPGTSSEEAARMNGFSTPVLPLVTLNLSHSVGEMKTLIQGDVATFVSASPFLPHIKPWRVQKGVFWACGRT